VLRWGAHSGILMVGCNHTPDGPYVLRVGQYDTLLRWHKTWCKKCSAVIGYALVDPAPPTQIDQILN
jgi:hypothetical protein